MRLLLGMGCSEQVVLPVTFVTLIQVYVEVVWQILHWALVLRKDDAEFADEGHFYPFFGDFTSFLVIFAHFLVIFCIFLVVLEVRVIVYGLMSSSRHL